MNRIQLEANFSVDRLSRYFNHHSNNETKAIYLYKANIALSEALYTSLSILEVALRNKINVQLIRKYGRIDWYTDWYKDPTMRYAWPEINNAIKHLHEDGKSITVDKVIACLMFGFWTSLFNDRYERELWANLRFIFPNMPRAIRQRRNISAPLNEIRRTLRNRIYHNEPVAFNLQQLNQHYNKIIQLLNWMGNDLLVYNNLEDRFPAVFADTLLRLNAL